MITVLCAFLLQWPVTFSGGLDTVPVFEEPFHQLIFADERVRLLDVGLMPGDTSDFHRHDDAIAYFGLAGSQIWLDVPGSAPRTVDLPADFWGGDIAYPEASFIHRIANVGESPFRLLAIEHLRKRENRTLDPLMLGGAEPLDANPYFIQHRLQIPGGDQRQVMVSGPVLLLCRGAGPVVLKDPERATLLGHGQWWYQVEGRPVVTLENQGVELVEVFLVHL